MKHIFVGEDKLMQPIWQIILLGLALIVGQIVSGLIIVLGLGAYILIFGDLQQAEVLARTFAETAYFMAIGSIVGNVVVSGLCMGLYKIFNKQTLASMGLTSLKKDIKDFAWGLGLGIVSISAIVVILMLFGDYKWEGFYVTEELFFGVLLFIAVGFGEEIMVRGAFQHIIARKHKIVWAIVLPSIIFSILHFGNPDIGNLAALNLFLVGILLAVITYKTQNLWTAIGFHITWNFVQGNIFGIEVSGMSFGKGLIHMTRTTDTIMNGGSFGLEAGYVCTIVLIILMGYYLAVYKRKIIR